MMTDKQIQTMFAAIEARINAQDARLDKHDEAIGGHTENINLLRGDAQRWADQMGVKSRFNTPLNPFASPVAEASGERRQADAKAREKLEREGRGNAAEKAQRVITPAA